MPRPAILVLLLVTVLASPVLSGCLDSVRDRFPAAFGEGERRAPYSLAETHALAPGATEWRHEFPVDAATEKYVIGVEIASTAAVPIAQVTVTVQDHAGVARANRTLDPRTTSTEIAITDFPNPGEWTLVVQGQGVANGDQGASVSVRVQETVRAR